jgi:hypothetical protein
MPGVSGVTVVTNARAFYTTRAAAGASGARHSLRPLIGEGEKFRVKPRANLRRDREVVSRTTYPAVIAREDGRSSIPETSVIEQRSRSIAAYWMPRMRGA